MRRFRGCQLSWHLKLPNIYEAVIDANVNHPVVSSSLYFRKSVFSFRVDSILKWRVSVSNSKFLDCVHFFGAWARQVNSRRVRTHKKNSGDAIRRLGTIIQSIFCAQSGASIRFTVWKWSCESRYPGALPPVLENFRRAISPGPSVCPWVTEDDIHTYIHLSGFVKTWLKKFQVHLNHLTCKWNGKQLKVTSWS